MTTPSITGHSENDALPTGDMGSTKRLGDRVFSGLATGSGVLVVVLIAAVAAFLVAQAVPALAKNQANFLTSREWSVSVGALSFGIADLLWVTVISSIVAMVIAVPVAIGVALFLTQYAPTRLARPFAALVDLLAAVPSIVYGIWGYFVLRDVAAPVQTFLESSLGWIPLFRKQTVTGTIFLASVVLAIMILPIITAISREVFDQTPAAHKEAALALGATKWEMVRTAVLPFGRPGIISAAMLGLGRALGETMVVAMVLSPAALITIVLTGSQNPSTIAGNIALNFPEAHGVGVNALIATGLILFVITLVINSIARFVINRRKAFSGAN